MNTPTTRTPELDAYVREMKAQGIRSQDIAAVIGCSETTVNSWLRKAPMEARPEPEPEPEPAPRHDIMQWHINGMVISLPAVRCLMGEAR